MSKTTAWYAVRGVSVLDNGPTFVWLTTRSKFPKFGDRNRAELKFTELLSYKTLFTSLEKSQHLCDIARIEKGKSMIWTVRQVGWKDGKLVDVGQLYPEPSVVELLAKLDKDVDL